MLSGFTDLIRRHRVDPGRLLHFGEVRDQLIPTYYDAGYVDITVYHRDHEHIKSVRTRFPGVNAVEDLDGTPLDAHTHVINVPGHEVDLLQLVLPHPSLRLAVVRTTRTADAAPTPYDLVTEAATTRGFVEVDCWAAGGDDVDVAFLKVAD